MAEAVLQEPIIEFVDVYKNYKDIAALRGVSFSIKKGEIFGYIGPNGAGKTTTLKILVGLIRDYEGVLLINGKMITNQNLPNKLIGYLPQEVGFQEWRTVKHALTTFGLLSGLSQEELKEKIPDILEIVGLSDAINRKIKHLSGGMRQKLLLAQALIHDPPILVLDEPMSGLDPSSRWQMRNVIQELAKRDITIVFSSHILGDVENIANTIGIINEGKVVKIGSPEELQNELIGGEKVEIIGENLFEKSVLISAVSNVSEIEGSSKTPNRIVVSLKADCNVEQALIELMRFFSDNNIFVSNFNHLRPSLEQVYLKYVTGGTPQ